MTFPARRPSVRRRARAAAVALLATVSLAACGTDVEPTSGDTPEGQESRQPKPADKATDPSGTPTESPAEDDGTTVPVYWVGDGPGGEPRLFREFHRVQGDPLVGAARLVTGGGQPDDPDYRTLWPAVDLTLVEATDGVLYVEVPTDGFSERPDGMTKRDAQLAVQQLVYTLQGVQQERIPVAFGRPDTEPRLFGLPTTEPFEQASALETLNLVNITSPAEGDVVSGGVLTVTGVANSFEASGPCRLLVDGVEMVLQPYQSEGWMEDRLFPFEVEFPLEGISGEVVVQCETDDPSGGAEGNGPAIDTRTITVE
jgi:hypothetical protein